MGRIEEAMAKAAQLKNQTLLPGTSSAPAGGQCTATDFSDKRETRELSIDNPYLITLNEPDSPVAEEYRKLKSVILGLSKKEGLHNVIMVTSSLGGEGKSITALNLAITLSEDYDHSVLLVDGDLRKPSLSTYLNIEAERGLSDCILEELDVEPYILYTGHGNLFYLPSGRSIGNPVEIFSSKRMKDFFQSIRCQTRDRYIIIDSPPLLPFAETGVISTLVDEVIFVVSEEMSTKHNITEALNSIKSNVLGVVYNNANITTLEDNYHYHYPHRKNGSHQRDVS